MFAPGAKSTVRSARHQDRIRKDQRSTQLPGRTQNGHGCRNLRHCEPWYGRHPGGADSQLQECAGSFMAFPTLGETLALGVLTRLKAFCL
jgi:hypothetical protein